MTDCIRLATFNVKNGDTLEGEAYDPAAIGAACASLGADILGLQETNQRLAELAAEQTGMELMFARTMRYAGEPFGNALLARGSVKDVEVLRLQRSDWLRHRGWPRKAILATVQLADVSLSVAVAHLSPPQALNYKQLGRVAAALNNRPAPRVLLGDFNRNRTQMQAHPLLEAMTLVEGPPTFRAPAPSRQIDHIAITGMAAHTTQSRGFPFSDHFALTAEIFPQPAVQ